MASHPIQKMTGWLNRNNQRYHQDDTRSESSSQQHIVHRVPQHHNQHLYQQYEVRPTRENDSLGLLSSAARVIDDRHMNFNDNGSLHSRSSQSLSYRNHNINQHHSEVQQEKIYPQQHAPRRQISRISSFATSSSNTSSHRQDDLLHSNYPLYSPHEASNASDANIRAGASSNPTAAQFAHSSAKAGYLQKLGHNIPRYKRRFFVLKPTTHLYYFLSPHDEEPRGCIDLDNYPHISEELLSDGRMRFELSGEKTIKFEARNEEIGREWIESIKKERLNTVKIEMETLKVQKIELEEKVSELRKTVEELRLVEKDRDEAVQDAEDWREKFWTINEAVRLLTSEVMKAPANDERENETPTPITQAESESDDGSVTLTLAKDKSYGSVSVVSDVEKRLDGMDLKDTYFSGLYNAFSMLRENLKLTSIDANKTIKEVHDANEKVRSLQKRMSKAEKLLCKLWEENCAMRDTIKQQKKERKVLVKEVKALLKIPKKNKDKNDDMSKGSNPASEPGQPQDKVSDGTREKRLIMELEDHVMSSLRLHEKFLSANGSRVNRQVDRKKSVNTQVNSDKPNSKSDSIKRTSSGSTLTSQNYDASLMDSPSLENQSNCTSTNDENELDRTLSPLRPRMLLTDSTAHYDSDGNDDSDCLSYQDQSNDIGRVDTSFISQYPQKNYNPIRFQSRQSNSYSKPALAHPTVQTIFSDQSVCSDLHSQASERQHPLTQLDDDSSYLPNLASLSSQSSTKSIIQSGKATSNLTCPYTDVTDSPHQIYHLTFYTKKIGLQFQKVPIGPNNGKIAHMTSNTPQIKNPDCCPVATPVDAVLVCGFLGFDDVTHTKPKLGARLVAFDGVSVEVGLWTFESVRKSIQARGRPLTLSFRNDYLTTKQRAILTKAVSEVGGHVNMQEARHPPRPPLKMPSPYVGYSSDLNTSGISNASSSTYTSKNTNRSFSDAGGSIVSTALAPLMANLMSNIGETEETPRYLTERASLEGIPYHADFKAGLL